MKKLLVLFALLGQIAFAQQIDVVNIKVLKGTESGGFYHPSFSPNGSYLLTTAENYAGLNQHSFATNEVKKLTVDAGAGYDVQVSADENTILFKKTEFQNNLRYTSLQQYNLKEKKATQVVKATREKITPAFAQNQVAYVKGSTLLRSGAAATGQILPFINIEDQKMVLYAGAKKTVLTPNGADASYFWASVSPDQKHIVYKIARGGTYVCTIDGKKPVALGKLNAPKWLNNQWVIGMDDKDDGDFIVSSDIVAATIDGKVRQLLPTPQTPVAMYPAASADGKHIAFNSNEGKVYIVDINIQK
jgi:Tol biopolymer transport system component